MNTNKILGNILGNPIKKDGRSRNKEYLGYEIKQKKDWNIWGKCLYNIE